MYTGAAQYYDEVYSFAGKNYQGEAQTLMRFIEEHLGTAAEGTPRPRLLDVACGTGRHLEYLKARFDVQGLDINQSLLALARRRNPDVVFYHGDMIDFQLEETYEIVTCLFSAIGYVKSPDNLGLAVGCMARHLLPGGILVIEPWFTPAQWRPNTTYAVFVDKPRLKIARVSTSLVEGRLSYFDFHYLIGTPQGTTHVVERHELGLFDTEEMRDVMVGAGLEVTHEPIGLTGRGLFIGRRR